MGCSSERHASPSRHELASRVEHRSSSTLLELELQTGLLSVIDRWAVDWRFAAI
jgi:hypothetical protein